MNYVSTRKAINWNWSNQKPHLALKTKIIIIKKKNKETKIQ